MDPGAPVKVSDLYDEGMVDIARLEGSSSFGELALIDGKPRFATIKCTQRTHFLTIHRDDFEAAKERIKIKERDEKVNYMKQHVPLFIQSRPSRTTLNRLAADAEYLTVTKDCKLISQGS